MMFPKQNNYNPSEKLILTKKILCECKLFYVDYKENKRGRFLKISEKDSLTKRTIIVPAEAIGQLAEILQEIVRMGDIEPKPEQPENAAPTEEAVPGETGGEQ
ncbi:DNA-binding protein [bacterium]|nr:DNA-binding protein [bacterium]